jgi:tripartite-type tricarboxylate transporter receptor subunit TctC
MRVFRASRLATTIALVASLAATAGAQEAVSAFYKGRQVTIVVGTTVGGGYDAYARLIAPTLQNYIPGRPGVIVDNMPGAGSNTTAHYVYAVAPKDGAWIASVFPEAIMAPLLGNATAGLDPSRFQYLGSANDDVYVCVARKDAPVQTFQDAFHKELIVGAAGSSPGADISWLLKNVLGVKFKIVTGYLGSSSVMLAIAKNELQGACGFAWPSISATNPSWFGPDGFMRVLVQTHATGYPALNAAGVPRAVDFADTTEKRALLDLFLSQTTFGRPYLMAPDVPKDRFAALRSAFMTAMRDPDLTARAKKLGLDVNAVDGETVQRLVAKAYSASPDLVNKLRRALKPQT